MLTDDRVMVRAARIALVIFEDVSVVHPIVGAGHCAFSHVPSGIMSLIGLNMPSFCGAYGARKNCSEYSVAEAVFANGELIAPFTTGSEPV